MRQSSSSAALFKGSFTAASQVRACPSMLARMLRTVCGSSGQRVNMSGFGSATSIRNRPRPFLAGGGVGVDLGVVSSYDVDEYGEAQPRALGLAQERGELVADRDDVLGLGHCTVCAGLTLNTTWVVFSDGRSR